MNVNFYICTDDRRKVNKSISTVNTINCNIKERCSLDSPVLIIAKEKNKSSRENLLIWGKNINFVVEKQINEI